MEALEIKNKRLVKTTLPKPAPSDEEVLIKVCSAGINRPDILQRQGLYPPPKGASDIPGLEVAGEIVESRHPAWAKGDLVCALLAGGGYAEYAVANGDLCLPVPSGLSCNEAASLPETYFTVWNNLFYLNEMRADQTILIHGGSSGIGVAAIQIVKAMGGIPYCTARNTEKCNKCIELGAEAAINYEEEDFVSRIKDLTYGKGVDYVLDMVGGDYLDRNIDCLSEGGVHISIAFLGGAKSSITLPKIMKKRCWLTGSTLRDRPHDEKSQIGRDLKKFIWPKLESGEIKPVIDSVFDFGDSMSAHKKMENSTHIGKIVLTLAG